jgi:membrane protein
MKMLELFKDPGRMQRLARHAWRHFVEDRCFEEAASLAYTSLLAMVPLLAVTVGIISAFPVFERWSVDLQDFIFKNFVPASGEQVQDYVAGFLGSASQLTISGTAALFIVALLLMNRIENAFNRIWRVTIDRNLGSRIAMYWAVLTLGPLALGAAGALSLKPMLEAVGVQGLAGTGWREAGIFLLIWLGFSLVFLLVPNRRVRVSHAATGALVSALLFEAGKSGFVAFVSNASYDAIYGALATIPVFLFWMYLVWVFVLLGASLAASLTTFNDRGGSWRWPARWEFLLAYRMFGHFWEAQKSGSSLSVETLLLKEDGVTETLMHTLLNQAYEAGFIARDQEGDWLLSRDLDDVSLLDLYHSGHFHLPLGETPQLRTQGQWDTAFLGLLSCHDDLSVNLGVSLKSIYSAAEATE